MNSNNTFFLLVFIFSGFCTVHAAKMYDWKTEFNKTEYFLAQGDYKNAEKKSKLFFSDAEKNGKNAVGQSAAFFQAARIYNGLGDFMLYEKNCKEGRQFLDDKTNEQAKDYAFVLLEGIKTYLDYGDLVNASMLARKGETLVLNGTIKDPLYLHMVYYGLAQVYFREGFLLKASYLVGPLKQYALGRIIAKELVPDAKTGKPTLKKLPSNEVKSRKRDYAYLLHFEINVLAENGLLTKADSLYKISNNWIREQLGSKDFAMVENLFLKGMVHERLGEDKEAYKAYTSALDLYATSKGLHYTHYCKETGRLFQKAVLIEERIGKGKEGSKDQISYDSKIKRYFGKKNFYYAQTILLEAEKDIISGDKEDAKKALSELLAKTDLIPAMHPERIRILKSLYTIHLLEEDYAHAENDLADIIEIKKATLGPNTPTCHLAQIDLAAFEVQYANKFKEAEQIFNNSLKEVIALEMDHHSPYYIKAEYARVKLYQATEQYGTAQLLMQNLVHEIKNGFGSEHISYTIALGNAAGLDIELGRYSEAEKKLNMVLNYFKTHELHSSAYYTDYMNIHIALARLQIIEGAYEEAEKNLKKANKLSKETIEYPYRKNGYGSEEMAILYMHTGKYQEAGKCLNDHVKLKELRLGNFNRNLINPYNQLGNLHLITGDYTAAEKYVRKAQAISLSIFGDSSLKYAESLKLLENIYTAIGDYERAEEAIRKVVDIEIAKYGINHALVANSLNDMALVKFLNKRNPAEVEKLFLQSLSIIKNALGEKTPQYAEVLKNLSLFYLETARLPEAEKNLEKVSDFWIEKLGKENIHSAEISMLQGNMLAIKGRYQEAKAKYTDARNIYASVFDSFHPHYVKAVSRIGQMNYILGEYKTCIKNFDETTGIYLNFIKKYFPSLSEREKNKFWGLIKNDFEFYNSLAVTLRASNPELIANTYNFALITKSLLLNSSIKVRERIVNSRDTMLIKKYEDWVAKKEYLVTVISMSLEQRKANQVDVKAIEKEIETMEKDLSSSSELFIPDVERETIYSWEKIKESLQPNEVAVEMVRFRKFTKSFTDSIYYAALLVTPQTKGHPELVLFENGKDLETKFIRYYRNAVRLKTDDNISYSNFWEPLGKKIKDNSIIYFSPEGVFSQINVETLKTPEGTYLLDKNEIVLISNTRDLIRKEKPEKAKKVALETASAGVSLFGNPTYYNNSSDSTYESGEKTNGKKVIQQLPGAEKEVKALFDLLTSSHWDPKLYLENDAQEEIVKNLKSPRVFHIATHGFFLEDLNEDNDLLEGLNESRSARNPLLRAGLLLRNGGRLMEHDNVYDFNLEDGILTAYEAMNLNLDKTDLVVLSACETGLGDVQLGEGVYGLQRSFQVAGAKSIIMSLFKVSDNVTQELMYNFYKKWISSGDKRKSFSAAKKEIKEKYPEPIYWGSFVMIGTN